MLSLRSSSNCLRLFSRLAITSILPSIFPSRTCFTIQFLRTMWPVQLAFIRFTICSIYPSSLTLCNTVFFTMSVQLIFPSHSSTTLQNFQVERYIVKSRVLRCKLEYLPQDVTLLDFMGMTMNFEMYSGMLCSDWRAVPDILGDRYSLHFRVWAVQGESHSLLLILKINALESFERS